jgi:hypothetical protein
MPGSVAGNIVRIGPLFSAIREFMQCRCWKREQHAWHEMKMRRIYRRVAPSEFYEKDGSEIKL